MEHHIRFDHSDNTLLLLDQRRLPVAEEDFVCRTTKDVIYALKEMVVRGAPAIGVTAAWGCVLAVAEILRQESSGPPDRDRKLEELLDAIATARPTAVNLSWAVSRMRKVRQRHAAEDMRELFTVWKNEAACIQAEDIAINKRIGEHGAALIANGDSVLTHCNAGALATAGHGTALGVLYSARADGKQFSVIADETRPFLQGARLTAYELQKMDIPVTVACDNACALLMQRGMVQKVIVGADRIAANGDTANKIGTYGVALLAKAHDVPFYVAAPLSTIDTDTPDGSAIAIEERPDREVTHIGDLNITPKDVPVFNFAFDVTPASLIAGIITEAGLLLPPYADSIAQATEHVGAGSRA